MKFTIALAAVAAMVAAKDLQQTSLLDYQYMQYAALFNKHTHSLSEYNDRMKEFGKSQKFIADWNAKLTSHFLGHNAYSDWTDAERDEFLSSGLVAQLKDHDHMRHHYARLNTEYIPDYVNWLEHGAVSPVKHDFSSCSSSWAHAAIDAIEGDVYLKTGKMLSLSTQQILDCDHASWGCHGGLYTNAFEYAINNKLMSEKDYPYVGKPQPCKASTDGANKATGVTMAVAVAKATLDKATGDKKEGVVKVTNFINILPHDAD